MDHNIVSFLETAKPLSVSILDLPSETGCQILRFMKYDRQMGELIREMRKQRGMTVAALADVLVMEKGTLSKKERGQSSFDEADLERAAAYFHIEKWKLVALASGVPREKLEFADVYDVVTPGFRADLLSLVRAKRNHTA